jgi:triosephosphate isomerase
MHRNPLLIGNLKSYFAYRKDIEAYFSAFELRDSLKEYDGEIALAVPYTHIRLARETISKNIRIGTQDISAYPPGAHTGEISAE